MAGEKKGSKKRVKKEPKYVKTAAEVCTLLEVSATTFDNWRKDPEFSGRFRIQKGKCGWPVSKLREFQIYKQEKSLATAGGDNADLKRIEIQERIRGLRLKNDIAAEMAIPMEDHLEELREVGQMVVRAWSEYREFSLVITKNPVLVEKLDDLEARVRGDLVKWVEG